MATGWITDELFLVPDNLPVQSRGIIFLEAVSSLVMLWELSATRSRCCPSHKGRNDDPSLLIDLVLPGETPNEERSAND
jgi:hypothetical protein